MDDPAMYNGRGMTSDGRGMTSDGRGMTSDGRGMTSDGRGMTSDGRGMTSDGRGMTSDGRGMTSDGRGMTSDGRGMTSDDRGMTSDGRGMTSDGRGIMSDEMMNEMMDQNTPSRRRKYSDRGGQEMRVGGEQQTYGLDGRGGDGYISDCGREPTHGEVSGIVYIDGRENTLGRSSGREGTPSHGDVAGMVYNNGRESGLARSSGDLVAELRGGGGEAVTVVGTHGGDTTTSARPRSTPAQPPSSAPNRAYKLGLYGWRRRCLYFLLLFLTATVTLNLALTLFFMRVLDFSSTGLGALQIVRGGLVATGPVHVMDALVATHVTSRPHSPLTLLAAHNVSISSVDTEGHVTSSMVLDSDSLSCSTGRLVIKDTQGRLLFSASKEEVVVGSRRLVVSGEGGAAFSGSVQTAHVSAPVGKSLLLESTTRSLGVSAPQGVTVESRAGSITAQCLRDLTLQSTGGMIKLATSRLVVRGLPTSTVTTSNPDAAGPDVYQVCVCSGGRIFLASPGGVCAADHNFCK